MTTDTATDREAHAEATIRKYVYSSAGVGVVPIPVLDFAAVLGIQLKMVANLARLYEMKFSRSRGKALIGALVGGAVPVMGAPAAASAVKSVPVVGQTLGAVTMPAFAGASTCAVGKVFVRHFESGGTFLNFDPDAAREYYAEQLAEAKSKK